MTFTQAIQRLFVSVNRDDLEGSYGDFINQAVRECAIRNNWDQMKVRSSVTFLADTASSVLPADFKTWQNGRFCVIDPYGEPTPVYNATELERLPLSLRPAEYLRFRQDTYPGYVELDTPVGEDLNYQIFYFAFPAVVSDPSFDDPNACPLLRDYPNLVMSKTLSLIFQSINDPVAAAHDAKFESELARYAPVDVGNSNPRADANKE